MHKACNRFQPNRSQGLKLWVMTPRGDTYEMCRLWKIWQQWNVSEGAGKMLVSEEHFLLLQSIRVWFPAHTHGSFQISAIPVPGDLIPLLTSMGSCIHVVYIHVLHRLAGAHPPYPHPHSYSEISESPTTNSKSKHNESKVILPGRADRCCVTCVTWLPWDSLGWTQHVHACCPVHHIKPTHSP